MGRSPCCSKEGLNRGAWTAIEDKILTDYIKVHGEGKWRNLPKRAGLKRCGKSCRLRWLNYLRPDIKRGNITRDEEELIIRLHNLLGNRWSLIAGRLPGRTDNEIKNYWNTNIGKRILSQKAHHHDNATRKTTCRIRQPKPGNKTSDELSPHRAQHEPSKSLESSRVVRTKATRCTKAVLFPKGAHNIALVDSKPAVPASTAVDDHDQISAGLQDPSIPNGVGVAGHHDHENNSNDSSQSKIHRDFETSSPDDHGNFLSDFLNIDGLEHFSNCFGEANEVSDLVFDDDIDIVRGDIMIGSCNKLGHVIDHPSPSPCDDHDREHREALLFSQDMLFGVDLHSATAELDWLQD